VLRVLYAGSPDISATVLKDLVDSGKVCIVGVLSNAPSAKGRHKTLESTPVVAVAHLENLCVIEPEKLDGSVREQIAALKPDIIVCFAYGKLFGPKFMALFPLGGINLHASLLPKHRGCAPAPAAILAGDSETGATVQRIAPEMDRGDILLQHTITLDGSENSEDILQSLTLMGTDMLLEVLVALESGKERAVAQKEADASYCTMLKKEDGLIDWTRTAVDVSAQVRAMYPWPGAFTYLDGALLSIHHAQVFDFVDSVYVAGHSVPGTVLGVDKECGILVQTGKGILAVQNLQKQGKKAMHWKDFINGMQNLIGACCTNSQNPS